MEETRLIMEFLDSLKGIREYDGLPKCKVMFSSGNDDRVTDSLSIDECEFDCKYIGDMVNVTLSPKNAKDLYPIEGAVKSYMARMQRSLKTGIEPESLYMIFAPNEDFWEAYVVMVDPIWWGFVSKRPMEKADSVRLLFQAQNVFYQKVDENYEKATESEEVLY